MKRYRITNSTNEDAYFKYFKDSEECYHWVVNTLDLSLEWTYNLYPSDTFISNKIKGL